MNDRDLKDLGGHLYSLEADPPKDGLKRIAAILEQRHQSFLIKFLRHAWWIPLLVVLPAMLDFTQHIHDSKLTAGAVNISVVDAKENTALNMTRQSNILSLRNGKENSMDFERRESVGAARRKVNQERCSSMERSVDVERMEANTIQATMKEGEIAHAVYSISGAPAALNVDSIFTFLKNTVIPVDTISEAINITKDEDILSGFWRWSISFRPEYVQPLMSPDKNDEVLVTHVADREHSMYDRINYGVGVGIGRQLSGEWFVDAHLTYTETSQQIFYQYNTGKVDSLRFIQRSDDHVEVTPVYEQKAKETANRYQFAGLRVSSTYYFWKNARRRFHLTTGVGMNYLVSARVRERSSDGWTDLSNNGLNKAHYNLSFAAGYSLHVGSSWELMVSPTLTQHLRPIRNNQLPYNVSQRSVGVNIVLLKSF